MPPEELRVPFIKSMRRGFEWAKEEPENPWTLSSVFSKAFHPESSARKNALRCHFGRVARFAERSVFTGGLVYTALHMAAFGGPLAPLAAIPLLFEVKLTSTVIGALTHMCVWAGHIVARALDHAFNEGPWRDPRPEVSKNPNSFPVITQGEPPPPPYITKAEKGTATGNTNATGANNAFDHNQPQPETAKGDVYDPTRIYTPGSPHYMRQQQDRAFMEQALMSQSGSNDQFDNLKGVVYPPPFFPPPIYQPDHHNDKGFHGGTSGYSDRKKDDFCP